MKSSTFSTALDHLQTEASELASELGKGSMYGLDFRMDGQHMAMERITDRLSAINACLDKMKEHGCDLTVNNDRKVRKKKLIIDMEVLMKEKNMFPIPSSLFMKCISLYSELEQYVSLHPLTSDIKTHTLLSEIDWSERDNYPDQMYSDRENVIMDHWERKVWRRSEESKRALLMDYVSQRKEAGIRDIIKCIDWFIHVDFDHEDKDNEMPFMVKLIRKLMAEVVVNDYKDKTMFFVKCFNEQLKWYVDHEELIYSSKECLEIIHLDVTKCKNGVSYMLYIDRHLKISDDISYR